MDQAKRKTLPDILKGLAVILMIQVHIMELFAREDIFSSLTGKISLFMGGVPAAPVFMLVMGYFISRSRKNLIQQILRGVKLILLGLLLNIGLNFHLLIRIMLGEYQLNPWEYILGADILFLAGFSIILISLIRKIFQERFYFYILLALLLVIIHPHIPLFGKNGAMKYLQAFFYGYYHWSYFPLLPWLAYPLVGFAFGLIQGKAWYAKILKAESFILAGSFILLIIGFDQGFSVSSNLELYYHHHWIFFLWAIDFMIFWAIGLKWISKCCSLPPLDNFLQWTGRNVTAFYVFQWLLIGNIATGIFKTQAGWILPVWFIVILAFSSLLVYLRIMILNSKKRGVL